MQTGERFGKLTVLAEQKGGKATCRCDCGKTVTVLRYNLSSVNTRSCGCLRKKHVINPGDRFGMLTVISLDGSKATCRCDCGKTVTVFRHNLLSGNTRSCGCKRNKTEFRLKPGDRFGMLTILSDQNSRNILCRCDCGKTVTVFRFNLSSGNTMSCGCQRNKTEFRLKPGDRFGMLTILSDQNSRNILCRCDCGNEVSVRRYSLTSGITRSCGCQRNSKKRIINPGDRFGRLTVLDAEVDGKFLCRCDCGNEVSVRRYDLKSGITRSCGCQRRNTTSNPDS